MAKKVGQRTLKATTTAKIDGKLQPQAIELEQAVLGALMIDNESLSDAIDSLQAEYFYKAEHQRIFEAIINLFNHTQPVCHTPRLARIILRGKYAHRKQPQNNSPPLAEPEDAPMLLCSLHLGLYSVRVQSDSAGIRARMGSIGTDQHRPG